MPIFISYSQKDRDFVESLASNLVAAKHHVWIDRWELSLGDSLTAKIEGALTKADAILVVLSKNSVESDWCRRELTAGLVRELEEKKVVVMPCVIDDCKIPLFLRDKLYADFRTDPDAAFNMVDRSLARISNPFQGRVEEPKFHTDWAVDWHKNADGRMDIRCTFIDHGHDWPYVILSECVIVCDDQASKAFLTAQKRDEHGAFMERVLGTVSDTFSFEPLKGRVTDQFARFVSWQARDAEFQYNASFTYRRLGTDTGMDTIVHLDNHIKQARDHITAVVSIPIS